MVATTSSSRDEIHATRTAAGAGANGYSTHGSNDDGDSNSNMARRTQHRQTSHRWHWRPFVRNFTPSWFAVTMGTGIVSNLLYNLPYNGTWLYYLSIIFFALNVVLFCSFLAISAIRYAVWPELWRPMVLHPTRSLFLATVPCGLSTIVNMIVLVCVPAWGIGVVYFAWALWWLDVVISVGICFYLPFVIMQVKNAKADSMTATWLLPSIAAIVASGSGSIVASALPDPQHALWTLLVSTVIWGTGICFAFTVLTVYFYRLTEKGLPAREVIVSVFLPIGPLGQGGFAAMKLGQDAMSIFPQTDTLLVKTAVTAAGDVFYVVGFLVALVMWGFALGWLFFAVATIYRVHHFPFNVGWWSFVFPLGVFTLSTLQMGKEIPSRFFDVLGTIFTVLVVLLWIVVGAGTVGKAVRGGLLLGPDLKVVEGREKEAARHFREDEVQRAEAEGCV